MYYNVRKGIVIGKGCRNIMPNKPSIKGSGKITPVDDVKETKVEGGASTPALDSLRQVLNDTRLSSSARRLGVAKKIRL